MSASKSESKPVKTPRAERLRAASQQRREQDKQEVRQAILNAATTLFAERGYQGFSLREIAEKIGYSPGTIYLYFADKDAILMAVMADGVQRFGEALTEAAAIRDPRARLAALGSAYIQFGLSYPANFQLMFMQRPDFLVQDGESIPPALSHIFGMWQQTVSDAMKAGIIREGDPGGIGDAFWALLHGVVSIAILMPRFDQARVQAMIAAALQMITHGVHPADES